MKRKLVTAIVTLILAGACAVSFSGKGEYEYEVEAGETDSITVLLVEPLPMDSTDENLDDEFDLLDDPDM